MVTAVVCAQHTPLLPSCGSPPRPPGHRVEPAMLAGPVIVPPTPDSAIGPGLQAAQARPSGSPPSAPQGGGAPHPTRPTPPSHAPPRGGAEPTVAALLAVERKPVCRGKWSHHIRQEERRRKQKWRMELLMVWETLVQSWSGSGKSVFIMCPVPRPFSKSHGGY